MVRRSRRWDTALIACVAAVTATLAAAGTTVAGGPAGASLQAVARSQAAAGSTLLGAGSWQATRLDLPLAWQVTRGAPQVVVAVVDTGVSADHPALKGAVLPGYDALNGSTNAADDNGHGTAIAGIVAATCPGCRILPVKALAGNGTGNWDTIAAGVVWAADHGAQVINLSIGAPRALDVLGAAVAHALAAGSIVVAAAGNDGRDESFYPAAYPGVVSVTGVDPGGTRYAWSNFGAWVSVAAPGCADTTWLAGGFTSDFCGTSTASPFVAGVAGLARSYDGSLDAATFGTALRASAARLPDGPGEVDANALLLALGAPAGPPVAGAPPKLTTPPRVGGRIGVRGSWSHAQTIVIHWQRSRDGIRWQDAGSGTTYTPRPSDRGARLRAIVTAGNVRGTTTAASAPSARVARRRA